jgi:hypothetical protein
MNTPSACLAMLLAFAVHVPAEDAPKPVTGPTIEALPVEPPVSNAIPPVEEKPVDQTAELRERLQKLQDDHPVLGTSALPGQWRPLLLEAAALQGQLAALKEGQPLKQAALQADLDERLLRLDQLATEAEVAVDALELGAKIDAQKAGTAKDEQRKRLAEARKPVDQALAAHHTVQLAALRKRQEGDHLQAQAEDTDQRAEEANHDIERLNDELGKIDDNLPVAERIKQRAAIRERITTALGKIHDLQSEALHMRQQSDLSWLAADALDDQAELASEAFDHQREALGTVIEAIAETVQNAPQGADNL